MRPLSVHHRFAIVHVLLTRLAITMLVGFTSGASYLDDTIQCTRDGGTVNKVQCLTPLAAGQPRRVESIEETTSQVLVQRCMQGLGEDVCAVVLGVNVEELDGPLSNPIANQ
eukprot:1178692-Prorocentrum_minimum.AAC.1